MFAIRFYIALCFVFLFSTTSIADELKLEEVISKHLSAIGNLEKRKALKNIMMIGTSEFHSKLPERRSYGKVAIVSDNSNLLFVSSFAAEAYPFEKIGFFKGKMEVPFVTPGIRSPLGDFLWEHPLVLKNGLFSGSMTRQWAFLGDDAKNLKMDLGGIKKIDGQKAYQINFFSGGTSGDLKVKLFFDVETFQHIRSEYREEFSGKQPKFGVLGTTSGYEIELIETFSDFKTYEEFSLPSKHKVQYLVSGTTGTYEYDWTFKISEVKFNQNFSEDFFRF